jgi:hypothetical protein
VRPYSLAPSGLLDATFAAPHKRGRKNEQLFQL